MKEYIIHSSPKVCCYCILYLTVLTNVIICDIIHIVKSGKQEIDLYRHLHTFCHFRCTLFVLAFEIWLYMFQGQARCSLKCLGSRAFKTQGHRIKYLSSLYVCLSEKILKEANWTSKKPFSCWRKCQEKETTSLHSSVQVVYSVCIRAFHQMKAWLRFVDIRNIMLSGCQGFPLHPSLPNVSPYCLLLARNVFIAFC